MQTKKFFNSFLYFFIILLFGSTVHAENPLSNPNLSSDTLKLNRSKLNELKPLEEKKEVVMPKPQKAEPKIMDFQSPTAELESKIEYVLDDQILVIEKLLNKYNDQSTKKKLWIRMAELYREKAQLVSFRLQQDHTKALIDWKKSTKKGKEPKLSLVEAQNYNRKAINLYKNYIEKFPLSSVVPMAMYYLGFNSFEIGQTIQGEDAYGKLMKKYPESPFGKLARLQLAEFHFENRKWSQARSLYEQILSEGDGPNYMIALYKYSWCAYHQGQNDLAIVEMKKLFEDSSNSKIDSSLKVRLVEEAEKGLKFLYAHTGRYKEAIKFFSSIYNGNKLSDVLAETGSIYLSRGHIIGAEDLYYKALKFSSLNPRAPEYDLQIVSMISKWKNPDLYAQKLYKVVNKYDGRSAWSKVNVEVFQNAQRTFEGQLYSWAMHNHRGLKFRTPGVTFERTDLAYNKYFSNFPDTQRSDKMHFYYADLLFDRGEFAKASRHYKIVKKNASSPYFEKALLYAVMADEKGIPSAKEIATAGKAISLNSLDEFAESADDYLKDNPKTSEALSIRYRLATVYYAIKDYDKAEEKLNSIIIDFPKTQEAKHSSSLVMDIYNSKGEFDKIVSVGQELLNKSIFKEANANGEFSSLVEKASFKLGESSQKEALHEKSNKEYMSYVKKYPNSSYTGLAYFNMGINYESLNDRSKSIESYERSLKSKNNDRFKEEAHRSLARLYHEKGKLELAANHYDRLAGLMKNSTEKDAILFTSGKIWFKNEKYQKAKVNFAVLASKKNKHQIEAKEKLVEIHKSESNWSKGIEEINGLLTIAGSSDSRRCQWIFDRGDFYFNNLKRAEYFNDMNEASKCYDSLSDADKSRWSRVGAESKYRIARKIYAYLIEDDGSKDLKYRQEQLKKKIADLDKLVVAFEDVIKVNISDYIVNSLAQVSIAYKKVAEYVEKTPPPAELKGTHLDQYKSEVNKVVAGLKKSSESYMELAKKKAKELSINSNFISQYTYKGVHQ